MDTNKYLLEGCGSSEKYLWLAQDFSKVPICERKGEDEISLMRKYIQEHAKQMRSSHKKQKITLSVGVQTPNLPTFLMPASRYCRSHFDDPISHLAPFLLLM